MQQRKLGFTLIELLVVVLIIGILASVALPQYTKAVEKAKAAKVLPLLKSVSDASEAYFMANGSYPTSFDQLDISIPWTGSEKWCTHSNIRDTRSNGEWSIQLAVNADVRVEVWIGRLSGQYRGAGFMLHDRSAIFKEGTTVCAERTSLGITYQRQAGSYCQKIFKGKLQYSSGSYRGYEMP